MTKQQEFICGLSREVTISVLPRLNMEELMFELNRRIQILDKENSMKDRLVSILRDVMLEEYRLLERRNSEVSSPNKTPIPVQDQETATMAMQENVLTENAETTLSETSSPYASQQSFGPDIVIKTESEANNEVLMHTKDLELHLNQIQLKVSQQLQLCNMHSRGPPTLPTSEKPLPQMYSTDGCNIKEEEAAMTTVDEAARACHDELNIDTPICIAQLQDTLNSMNSAYSETICEEAPSASCHLPPDHGDIHVKMECHVSEDNQIRQMSQASNPDQTEHYTDDRENGFNQTLINSGHELSGKDSSKETPLTSCQPTSDQDCENMTFLPQDNDSRVDSKRYVCEVCGFNTTHARYLTKHAKRHSGEKPFLCGECGYRARYKYQLVEHMRTHTGEKPFRCKECDYRTAYKGDISKHMRCHTDERPYSCQDCDYRTKVRSDLAKHMRHKHQ
ncbi:zinc finger protein 567-like [Branchiostoma floridae]|uniref:Zinc finger protein 567-like n=1 Tax=Branchiostoma floridae TaxID=7739 RepID=A0A9J7KKD9_BRAFL|nr:zinc finger protein 567-like [Branchiostoma floridae]